MSLTYVFSTPNFRFRFGKFAFQLSRGQVSAPDPFATVLQLRRKLDLRLCQVLLQQRQPVRQRLCLLPIQVALDSAKARRSLLDCLQLVSGCGTVLVQRSLPTPNIRGSNRTISKIYGSAEIRDGIDHIWIGP